MIARGSLRQFCAAVVTAGCVAAPGPAEQPARLVAPSAASRAELAQVVAEALHAGKVPLADDALTDSGILVVERRRTGSLDGPPPTGRDLGTPERFRLVSDGKRCVLIHDASGRRYELREATCVVE